MAKNPPRSTASAMPCSISAIRNLLRLVGENYYEFGGGARIAGPQDVER